MWNDTAVRVHVLGISQHYCIYLWCSTRYVKLNDITTPKASTAQSIRLILTITQVPDCVDCHGIRDIRQILDLNL